MKNENRIKGELCKLLGITLNKSEYNNVSNEIKTSVDFVYKTTDKTFLFEVDSNNAAKIVFGQYLLLNKAKDLPNNPFLIIIHCYKGYNKERTTKHLNYAIKNYNCTIPFVALSEDEWIKQTKDKNKKQIDDYLKSLTIK
jgi:hypothetical protein